MMARFRMLSLPMARLLLAKSDGMGLCRSHHHRFLFSISGQEKKSHKYLGSSLLNFPALHEVDKLMFSSIQSACFSNLRTDDENRSRLEVEIISTDYIKPAVSTPKHLRTYKVSILDQIMAPFYMPFVYFYPNDHQSDTNLIDLDDLLSERRLLLKRSLSETLTRFYPLAGKVKDYRHIDCSDDGVYFIDAKVRYNLSEFLSQPGDKSVQPLVPFGSDPIELLSKTHVVMIQLTTFSCGGISIGLCASHKIIDGYSYTTFLKAWAATACESLEDICPKFISPSIFPSTPTLPESASFVVLPAFLKQGRSTTKRFVFRDLSLEQLKKKGGASRVLAVTALIWKCAIKALKSRSTAIDCSRKSSSLTTGVSLRERSLPPMPQYSMGNIGWNACATQCCEDIDFPLDLLVQRVKNSIDKLNGDFVEELKGDKGSHKIRECLNEMKMFYSDEKVEHIFITSICNIGTYEANFGWGKPIWVSCVDAADNVDASIPVLTNSVLLLDTRAGKGIEAWVTLSDTDMAIFERDPELLEMASVNPNPLE